MTKRIGRLPHRPLAAGPAVALATALMMGVAACTAFELPLTSAPTAVGPLSATRPPTEPEPTEPVPTEPVPTAPATALVVDSMLLAALPASVDGVPMIELPDAEADVLGDRAIARVADRLAVAAAATADRTDWAIAWVIGVRPDALSVEAFRRWRDTYDAGACTSNGGAAGHAEAEIGGRAVFITTCGVLVVHHVRLADPDRLVAVTSSGRRRFGERILTGLAP